MESACLVTAPLHSWGLVTLLLCYRNSYTLPLSAWASSGLPLPWSKAEGGHASFCSLQTPHVVAMLSNVVFWGGAIGLVLYRVRRLHFLRSWPNMRWLMPTLCLTTNRFSRVQVLILQHLFLLFVDRWKRKWGRRPQTLLVGACLQFVSPEDYDFGFQMSRLSTASSCSS